MRDTSKVTVEERRAMMDYFDHNYTAGQVAIALIPHLEEDAFLCLKKQILDDMGESHECH